MDRKSWNFNIERTIQILTTLLTFAHDVLSFEIKCIRPEKRTNGMYHLCNYTQLWRTFSSCCYNAELDYYYCCNRNEFKSMSQSKRVGGAIVASTLIILLILLLCILSNRCPLRRALCKRGPNNDQVSSNVRTTS